MENFSFCAAKMTVSRSAFKTLPNIYLGDFNESSWQLEIVDYFCEEALS